MKPFAISIIDNALQTPARALAEKLSLPFIQPVSHDDGYLLLLTPHHLCLQDNKNKSNPIYVDFLSEKLTYRRRHTSLKKETLAKAIGFKNKTILDATGGLGQDSFILACLGFSVTLIERSPIIHALLNDGIERAKKAAELATIMQRITLHHANSIDYLKTLTTRPEVIYLDPMFPESKKSALSRKEMRILHDIVGDDADADALLPTAMGCALKRVVVKRPRLAPPLASLKPSYALTGNSGRFDVYLTGT